MKPGRSILMCLWAASVHAVTPLEAVHRYFEFSSEKPTAFYYSVFLAEAEGIHEPSHAQFDFSPRFRIRGDNGAFKGWNLTATYYGIYGFYLGSWDSGPVISRVQNPYIYVGNHADLGDWFGRRAALTSKIFLYGHESNGMYLTKPAHFDSIDALYRRLDIDHDSRSFASMGWNYYGGQVRLLLKGGKLDWMAYGEYRMYVPQDAIGPWNAYGDLEDTIFYDGGKPSERIWHYDGFRLSGKVSWKVDRLLTVNLYDQIRTGLPSRGLHLSNYVELSVKLDQPQLFVGFDWGYGRDLATYPFKYKRVNFGIQGWL